MKKITKRELVTMIDREMAVSLSGDSDKLARQRAKAMKYYLGEPYGNEVPDQSSIVTREVMDTIEWIKPELMKLFASGIETVRFEPQNPQDVDAAQQATDYINYLFHRKNPGFKILYQWINDGLLQKNGIVKIYYDDEATKQRETYADLDELEMQALLMREDIEPVEIEENEDGSSTVTVLRTGACSGLKVINVPPEEFFISRKAMDIESAPFCAHVTRMPLSDLKAMGYNVKNLPEGEHDNTQWEEEYRARHAHDNTERDDWETDTDPTMKEVWVEECYVRADRNGDGIAELIKVLKVGSKILDEQEVDCAPFAGWTPIIISHKFHGLSIADLVMDLQELKSQLLRNMLDNQYLTNNGRYEAIEGMVNLDDLLTSRPHGVVRTKMQGAVKRLDTPQLGTTAFQMLEYVDQLREKRTGVSERTQGMDPSQLSANTAATAVNQVMTAAQQRIELIARVFGETGLTDLFRLMYKFVLQNQKTQDIFRLRDTYISVDPSEWIERKDTSVVVGLGNGSREQEMLMLNNIFQNQLQLAQIPQFASVITAENLYNTLEDQVKVFNKAAAGRHFTDPASPEAQQAAQQQQQQQQQMAQMEQQLQQALLQIQQQEAQIKEFAAQAKAQTDARSVEVKERAQIQSEIEHEDEQALAYAELEVEKSQGRGVDVGD